MKYFKFYILISFAFVLFFSINSTVLATVHSFNYSSGGEGSFSVDEEIDPTSFYTNSTIGVWGHVETIHGSTPEFTNTLVLMTATINGQTKNIINDYLSWNGEIMKNIYGFNEFTAPSTPGNYTAVFTVHAFDNGQTSTYNFPFNVVSAPTVTITATPNTVGFGQTSSVHWVASGSSISFCSSSGGGGNGTTGTFTTPPLYTNTTYTVKCLNNYGLGSQNITINVNNNPTVSVFADPSIINSGETSNIDWTSTGLETCNSGGNGTGSSGPNAPDTFNMSPTTTTT